MDIEELRSEVQAAGRGGGSCRSSVWHWSGIRCMSPVATYRLGPPGCGSWVPPSRSRVRCAAGYWAGSGLCSPTSSASSSCRSRVARVATQYGGASSRKRSLGQ